jgi:hypothetical protein
MTAPPHGPGTVVETRIPARLDALSWGRFHTLVVVALGITWILDGLEVTLAGSVSSALTASPALHLTEAQVGLSASAYLAGAVLGALGFGWLTDLLGRKRLFFITLGLYVAATAATAAAQDFAAFALFRFATGAGIGGEYAAINSAIQELIPARYRGRTDIAINGSFWSVQRSAQSGRVCCWRPGACRPTSAGEWRSASARRSASASCSCVASCPKVRVGFCCTAGSTKRNASRAQSSAASAPRSPLKRRRFVCACASARPASWTSARASFATTHGARRSVSC